jgi:hypothetical protein
MGHVPTATVGALAAVLTGLYFVLPDAVHFTMLVFIIAAWFLTAICWLAQKSADYMHKYGSHNEIKKKLTENQVIQTSQISAEVLEQTKIQFSTDLEELKDRVKIKDNEIEKLKIEITNLKTLVEIESLRTELAHLKILAAQENTKNRKKK